MTTPFSSGAFPIPVVGIGPGSQPEAEAPECVTPGEMAVFRMPIPRQAKDPADAAAAIRVIGQLRDVIDPEVTGGPGIRLPGVDLAALPAGTLALVNECLGEGEVSAVLDRDTPLRIQETAFAGLWHLRRPAAGGNVAEDLIEAGPIPTALLEAAQLLRTTVSLPPEPEGLMNALPLIHELIQRSARWQPGQAAHVVNLTLLPMTPADLEYIDTVFGRGGIAILSRGYGNCRITATGLRHLWWVQYFNAMDSLILNTLEVCEMPEAALAAAEDLRESRERLGEYLLMLQEDLC
ncbi:MAG: hypothetical protein JNK22_11425 [Rhodocyclaceae bacterium]|nr:hypothetical protein [Rhodocyclaceae bacterium]